MTKKRNRGSKPLKPHRSNNPKQSPKHSKPEDDKALWQVFAKGVDPLDLKGRVPDTERDLLREMLHHEESKTNGPSVPIKKAPKPQQTTRPATAQPAPKSSPQTNQIDTRQVRRIGTGRDGIDARIDLHGMRQHEAHGALRAFLLRSVSKGHRMVLVITGKGLTRPDEENCFGTFINEGALGRGVLRRNVPLWLAEPELRSIVVGHTPAHIRHGGDGALYVQLRRRK